MFIIIIIIIIVFDRSRLYLCSMAGIHLCVLYLIYFNNFSVTCHRSVTIFVCGFIS